MSVISLSWFKESGLELVSTSSPAHLFAIRGKRKRVFKNCSGDEVGEVYIFFKIFVLFNPFVPTAPFLHTLKTLENLFSFLMFSGKDEGGGGAPPEKGCIANKWVNDIQIYFFRGKTVPTGQKQQNVKMFITRKTRAVTSYAYRMLLRWNDVGNL